MPRFAFERRLADNGAEAPSSSEDGHGRVSDFSVHSVNQPGDGWNSIRGQATATRVSGYSDPFDFPGTLSHGIDAINRVTSVAELLLGA